MPVRLRLGALFLRRLRIPPTAAFASPTSGNLPSRRGGPRLRLAAPQPTTPTGIAIRRRSASPSIAHRRKYCDDRRSLARQDSLKSSVRNARAVIRFRTMRPLPKQILTYLALVFTFSSLPEYVMIHSGHVGAGNGLAVSLVMWCPAFAALATCWLFRIDLATLGWNWRPAKYQAWAYFIPILYALPVYVATWALIPGSFAFSAFAAPSWTSFRIPAIAARRDPSAGDAVLCDGRRCQQHGARAGRRNWLARIPASATGSTNGFYLGMPLERLHLGGMALSGAVVRRLQLRHAASFCSDLLHPHGDRG